MFVGHACLAFALVAVAARRLGRSDRHALAAGVVAGAFATAPDVDILYALTGLVGVHGGPLAAASSFWTRSTAVHRAVTHSVVLAPVVAAACAAWVRGGRGRVLAAATLATLAFVAATTSGVLGGAMLLAFALATLGIAAATRRYTTLSVAETFAAAVVGLASHPFGDLFTGHPPAFLYPFDATLVAHRVTLSADPTLHLLGAFGVELGVVWLAVLVALELTGTGARVTPRATLGAGYAGAVLLLPPPTLTLSYPFVFSVLAVGALGLLPRVRLTDGAAGGRRPAWDGGLRPTDVGVGLERLDARTALLTGLVTVTVAWAAYGVAYVGLAVGAIPA